jgi:hypothetical protein
MRTRSMVDDRPAFCARYGMCVYVCGLGVVRVGLMGAVLSSQMWGCGGVWVWDG